MFKFVLFILVAVLIFISLPSADAVRQSTDSADAAKNSTVATSARQTNGATHPDTVNGVIAKYGDEMRKRLEPVFAMQNVRYPPKKMTWIGLKEEKQLVLCAPDFNGKSRRILSYPVLGASGGAGPKLREGDKQVPEGFYRITRFRPVVMAHLGMEVDYPNAEDRKHAVRDGRKKLGSDIMIHGSYWSTGCLAMGNDAIEELFVLAHDVGPKNIEIIFAPCKLTARDPNIDFKTQPAWLPDLYARIRAELKKYF